MFPREAMRGGSSWLRSPDSSVTLGVVILQASLLQQVETLISTDVRLVQQPEAIDGVERDQARVDPVPDGGGHLAVDADRPVQVVSVAQQVGGVHPVSPAPPPAVVVAVLRARGSVEVQDSLQSQLLQPGQASPEVVQGAPLALPVQVGGGERLVRLDVPVPVTWGAGQVSVVSSHL